jgi:hypothetical protein
MIADACHTCSPDDVKERFRSPDDSVYVWDCTDLESLRELLNDNININIKRKSQEGNSRIQA